MHWHREERLRWPEVSWKANKPQKKSHQLIFAASIYFVFAANTCIVYGANFYNVGDADIYIVFGANTYNVFDTNIYIVFAADI